jgi:putative chitinase
MIDRKKFFDTVRSSLFAGKLKQSQVDGMTAILNEWEARGLTDLRWLAYILATTYHEVRGTMQPIREDGRGKGKLYGRIDPKTGHAYYGRGFVQLTWASNYKTMSKLLGVDLYNHPDLALDVGIATQIMFEGMLTAKSFRGDFTGRSLEQYFNDKVDDPVNARRIINGTDKAKLIAGYHYKFLEALS